jgi:hypothetical protein
MLAVMSAILVFGQNRSNVAVYVTGGDNVVINKVLGDKLVAAFASSGEYIAIERTSNFLVELDKEQNYQRTGAVDNNQISRLGKQFGAQLVCVAEVSDVFGEKYVSARLIDVESAKIMKVANIGTPINTMQQLVSAADMIAKELSVSDAKKAADEMQAQKRRTINELQTKRNRLYEQYLATQELIEELTDEYKHRGYNFRDYHNRKAQQEYDEKQSETEVKINAATRENNKLVEEIKKIDNQIIQLQK